MIKYVKIHNEFINFINTLEIKNITEYEKKFLNLIIDAFDNIAELGTQKGKRAIYLSELIQKKGHTVSDELKISDSGAENVGFSFNILTAVEVNNFRGFDEKEIIPFEKQLTFLHGSNGSGKSSLCEALEYSMLGYVNEAIAKRIPIEDYIKNSKSNIAEFPILSAVKNGTPVEVKSNPSLYHFCFIEKNRIDNFARISANTPKEKSGLLSTLFGLDEFNNFVNEFTGNIEKYIDVVGIKNIELNQKSSEVKVYKEALDENKKEIEKLLHLKKELAEKINLASTIDETEELIKVKLQDIDKKLSQPQLATLSFPPIAIIDKQFSDIKELLSKKIEIDKIFLAKSDEVSFMDLYNAAVNLEPSSKDNCPLCETPIESTIKHPYENAKKRIDDLKIITELQSQRKQLILDINSLCDSFVSFANARAECALKTEFLKSLSVYSSFKNSPDKIIDTFSKDRDAQLTLDEDINKYNESVKKHNLQRVMIQKDKEIFAKYQLNITGLKAKENSIIELNKRLEQQIKSFEEENKKLIKDAEEEKKTVSTNIKYFGAYKSIISKLRAYKENLPLQQIAELNQLTLEIYNVINSHDKEYERLENIVLPTNTDDTILISFKGNHGKFYDALQILSEGHIRCLGLAILLAKNIRDNLPIVIMDDIVNAIDDDHRRGVSKLIFENEYIKSKQVILTTHSSMFVKELEQYLPSKDYDKLISKLIFLPDENERKIRVKSSEAGNYLLKAKKHYDNGNDKEALYNCRCTLENNANRLWKKISKKYKTDLLVVMRAPSVPPDLMSLVQSLNSCIKKNDIKDFSQANDIFDFLIGLKSKYAIAWEYLNKGTHEEEGGDDFDHSIVNDILTNLTQLDALIK
jgi:recombinational DNA repair ATPase RecF